LAGFFEGLGIPFAAANAYLVIAVELLGGLAMIAGLGTRIVAVLFAAVHGQHGFFLPDGYEFVLALFAASATLSLQEPGALAVVNVMPRRGAAATAADVRHARAA